MRATGKACLTGIRVAVVSAVAVPGAGLLSTDKTRS